MKFAEKKQIKGKIRGAGKRAGGRKTRKLTTPRQIFLCIKEKERPMEQCQILDKQRVYA